LYQRKVEKELTTEDTEKWGYSRALCVPVD